MYLQLSGSCGWRVQTLQTGSSDHIGFPPGYLPRTTALLTVHGEAYSVQMLLRRIQHTNYLDIYTNIQAHYL